jgi:hypothetical protein
MGWWTATEDGGSFATSGNLMWGDSVADIMDEALAKIVKEFQDAHGRKPTQPELISGLLFSLPTALEDEEEPESSLPPNVLRMIRGEDK